MSLAFLGGMLWKSAAIAGIALLLLKFLKSQAAAERAAVLRVAIVVLLALPLIALAAPAFRIAVLPPEPAAAPITSVVLPVLVEAPAPVVVEEGTWDNPGPLIETLYLGGVALILMRLGVGLFTLRRWTQGADPVTDPDWLAAFETMRDDYGASPHTRLLETYRCGSPLSWGFRRPVILIDSGRIMHSEDAEAILAHEFAHITRRDWLMLMLMHICTALFWFNPLVWMLEREAIQQAEEAADAQALRAAEPAHYAQMLLSYAEYAMPRIPANCMAPDGGIARRVKAILAHGLSVAKPKRRWAWMAMLACVGVAAPISAMKFVAAEQAKSDAAKPSIASDAWAAEAGVAPAKTSAPVRPVAAPKAVVWTDTKDEAWPESPPAPPSTVAPAAPVAAPAPVSPPAPMAAPAPVAPPAPAVMVRVKATGEAKAYAFAMSQADFESHEAIREARREADRARREAERETARAKTQAERERQQAWREEEQAKREAEQDAERERQHALRDKEQAKREAAQAEREAARERAQAYREAQGDIEEAQREALREARETVSSSAFRNQVADLATKISANVTARVTAGLREGAVGMEEGARNLDLEANKLRDPSYRKAQIEKNAARGHTVTDQDLLNAIPKMEAGAQRMREGAQRMREGKAREAEGRERMAYGAEQMRRGADRMTDGAQRMRETAAKLRHGEFRRQQIADAARRGDTVTDEQLRKSIPELENGAASMEREAARMRKSADAMGRS